MNIQHMQPRLPPRPSLKYSLLDAFNAVQGPALQVPQLGLLFGTKQPVQPSPPITTTGQ